MGLMFCVKRTALLWEAPKTFFRWRFALTGVASLSPSAGRRRSHRLPLTMFGMTFTVCCFGPETKSRKYRPARAPRCACARKHPWPFWLRFTGCHLWFSDHESPSCSLPVFVDNSLSRHCSTRRLQSQSARKPKVPAKSEVNQTDHPGEDLDSPDQTRGRCEDCAAQRPHDGAHERKRERTVRREHLMRRSQVRGSTRHTDRSISASMPVSRSGHSP